MEDEKLAEVHVDLPNHWAIGGESMWALPLGGDLYELRNVPCYAYDLNMGDTVIATAEPPGLIPQVRSVTKRSGHSTLRALFNESVGETERKIILKGLEGFGAAQVQVTDRFFAFDIPPGGDYDGLYLRLEELEGKGSVQYETCEARLEGSFDDLP